MATSRAGDAIRHEVRPTGACILLEIAGQDSHGINLRLSQFQGFIRPRKKMDARPINCGHVKFAGVWGMWFMRYYYLRRPGPSR